MAGSRSLIAAMMGWMAFDFALVFGAKNLGQNSVDHREVSLQREIRCFYSSAGGLRERDSLNGLPRRGRGLPAPASRLTASHWEACIWSGVVLSRRPYVEALAVIGCCLVRLNAEERQYS